VCRFLCAAQRRVNHLTCETENDSTREVTREESGCDDVVWKINFSLVRLTVSTFDAVLDRVRCSLMALSSVHFRFLARRFCYRWQRIVHRYLSNQYRTSEWSKRLSGTMENARIYLSRTMIRQEQITALHVVHFQPCASGKRFREFLPEKYLEESLLNCFPL